MRELKACWFNIPLHSWFFFFFWGLSLFCMFYYINSKGRISLKWKQHINWYFKFIMKFILTFQIFFLYVSCSIGCQSIWTRIKIFAFLPLLAKRISFGAYYKSFDTASLLISWQILKFLADISFVFFCLRPEGCWRHVFPCSFISYIHLELFEFVNWLHFVGNLKSPWFLRRCMLVWMSWYYYELGLVLVIVSCPPPPPPPPPFFSSFLPCSFSFFFVL